MDNDPDQPSTYAEASDSGHFRDDRRAQRWRAKRTSCELLHRSLRGRLVWQHILQRAHMPKQRSPSELHDLDGQLSVGLLDELCRWLHRDVLRLSVWQLPRDDLVLLLPRRWALTGTRLLSGGRAIVTASLTVIIATVIMAAAVFGEEAVPVAIALTLASVTGLLAVRTD